MASSDASQPYELSVDRAEFVAALKAIAKFKQRGGGFARFSYADGELAVAMPNVTIRVTAQGTWPAEVLMAGEWVKRMARVPPPGDPIQVSYDGSHVRVGTTVIPAAKAK